MKVLITGGGGFVGSHLAEAFLARGDEVWVLDNGSAAKVRHLLGRAAFHHVRGSSALFGGGARGCPAGRGGDLGGPRRAAH